MKNNKMGINKLAAMIKHEVNKALQNNIGRPYTVKEKKAIEKIVRGTMDKLPIVDSKVTEDAIIITVEWRPDIIKEQIQLNLDMEIK